MLLKKLPTMLSYFHPNHFVIMCVEFRKWNFLQIKQLKNFIFQYSNFYQKKLFSRISLSSRGRFQSEWRRFQKVIKYQEE